MTTATRAPALRFSGVTKQFAGGTMALADASLQVAPGEFVSVVGPSGCGKSTLLRIASGLDGITAGSVEVGTKRLGYVFQDATLLPWRSALENVRLPLEVGPKKRDRVGLKTPEELLRLVGLAGREHALPHELSGGMRHRVAIARALVSEPRVLLMDEPFGALDEITRDTLNEELLRIWRETGTTILFVTHSIPEAVFLSERVLVLATNPGRVRELVACELPYPRPLSVRETPEFIRIASHLRALLQSC